MKRWWKQVFKSTLNFNDIHFSFLLALSSASTLLISFLKPSILNSLFALSCFLPLPSTSFHEMLQHVVCNYLTFVFTSSLPLYCISLNFWIMCTSERGSGPISSDFILKRFVRKKLRSTLMSEQFHLLKIWREFLEKLNSIN